MDVLDYLEIVLNNPDIITRENVGRGALKTGKLTADSLVKIVHLKWY